MISVVIPAYNVEKYIRQCMDSVVNQTYKDLEIIAVDDGSTDNTVGILEEYAAKDNRITVLKQQNKGAGTARNLGLSKATGEYIIFLDADDFSEPDMLERALAFLQEKSADVCVFKSYEYDDATGAEHVIDYSILDWMVPDSNEFSWRDNPERIFNFCNGWPWDKLYRKAFIDKTGLTFQEIRTSNDTYFVLTSLALADKICTLRVPLLHHRVNNNTSLSTTREKSYECCFMAAEKLIDGLMTLPYFDQIEQSLYNCVSNFFNWHMSTISSQYKRELFVKMKEEILVKYPFLKKNRRDYEPVSLFDGMQNIADFDYQNFLLNQRIEANKEAVTERINLAEDRVTDKLNRVLELLDENRRLSDELNRVRTERDDTKEHLGYVMQGLKDRESECELLRSELARFAADVDDRNAEIDKLVRERDGILRCATYKVGAVILFIPKKIANLFSKKKY